MGKKRTVGLALACAVLLVAGGCGFGTDPLTSALTKIATGRILSLTVEEIQAVTIYAEEKAGVEQVPLTDEQADAVLQFLADNDINNLTRVQYLAENPQEIIISDAVLAVLPEDSATQLLTLLGQAGS